MLPGSSDGQHCYGHYLHCHERYHSGPHNNDRAGGNDSTAKAILVASSCSTIISRRRTAQVASVAATSLKWPTPQLFSGQLSVCSINAVMLCVSFVCPLCYLSSLETSETESTRPRVKIRTRRLTRSTPLNLLMALFLVILQERLLHVLVTASRHCDTDSDCQAAYGRYGSKCMQTSGTCENPFKLGCLQAMLGKNATKKQLLEHHPYLIQPRLCNSDDYSNKWNTGKVGSRKANESDQNGLLNSSFGLGDCRTTPLEYPEIRIHNGNWDSSLLLSWIYQIVLMEIVSVPATVGLSTDDTKIASFYNVENADMVHSKEAYPYEALETANARSIPSKEAKETSANAVALPGFDTNLHDKNTLGCHHTVNPSTPCVHVLPEVWSAGQQDELQSATNVGAIGIDTNGMIGTSGIYIPKFTAQLYPELSVTYGLQGEENRHLLSSLFKKPLTWLQYCRDVSPTQCDSTSTADGGVATSLNSQNISSPANSSSPSLSATTNAISSDVNYNNYSGGSALANPSYAASYPTGQPTTRYEGLKDEPDFQLKRNHNIHENNGTSSFHATTVAVRYPLPDEEDMYYSEGLFHGFFHDSAQNDCVRFPKNCSGHIIIPPCDWSAYVEAQLYWNDIVGLSPSGPLQPNAGYNSSQMVQIWHAANATKSHVVMWWYSPDPLLVQFWNTPSSFQKVSLPSSTLECIQNTVSQTDRCSKEVSVRRGASNKGSCDYQTYALQRIIAKSVLTSTTSGSTVTTAKTSPDGAGVGPAAPFTSYLDIAVNEAERSPAYEFLTNLKVSELEMDTIINSWISKDSGDKYGNDAREAVCEWVVENLEALHQAIPRGYPKHLSTQSEYEVWYVKAARGQAVVVGFCVLVAIGMVVRYQETKTMVFAQPFFILLILFGFLFITIGSYLIALSPTVASCMTTNWFVVLGYTIHLVPVLVKTAAFNKLIQSSKKMKKRVNISRRWLFLEVAIVVLIVVICLLCWSIIDPPLPRKIRRLSKDNIAVVEEDLLCSSRSQGWRIAALSWVAMLLLVAAVLAFQSRKLMRSLNESKTLAVVVYSHFSFVVLRAVYKYFWLHSIFPSSVLAVLYSLNYSIDTFISMILYVVPKLVEARKSPEPYRLGRVSASNQSGRASNSMENFDLDHQLKVLICSGNIGNAKPTPESMEAWIPPGGSCNTVSPLSAGARAYDGDMKSEGAMTETNDELSSGEFDIIVIGMQESTWSESSKVSSSSPTHRESSQVFSLKEVERPRGEQITEQEVLNALEDSQTRLLREMIQIILGDNYSQIADERRGQMRLLVWASSKVVDDITDIRISGANTGIGKVLANKGGIVVTLNYLKTRISFVSCHLAAHEGESYYKARCDNVRSIIKEATTSELSQTKLDVTMSSHYVFFFGDLNFRTKFGHESKHEENVRQALELIGLKAFAELYSFDELQEGIKNGDLLVGFQTLPCHFPPTFKVQREPGYVYKPQRTPSYTDRICFKSADGLWGGLTPLGYEACADFVTSDHKPIRGAFSIVPNEIMDLGSLIQYGHVRLTFRRMECKDLPAADADGLSDPYVMFLWDSVDLAMEETTFMDTVRLFVHGRSWPRTKYISKTLNPKWKNEEMTLVLRENSEIGSESMLHLVLMDYDAFSKDSVLCVLTLNLRDLLLPLATGDAKQQLKFDRPLQRGGKNVGRIKFRLDIEHTTKQAKRRLSAFFSPSTTNPMGRSLRSI